MGSWIDATIWTDEGFDESEFRKNISTYFERYAYGRESAPSTGRRHLQFRGILACAVGSPEEKAYCTMLSTLGFRHITRTGVRDFEYVYKEGDYYASWEKTRECYVNGELCPWQLSVCRPIEDRQMDDRTIEIYVDLVGNSGKTWLGRYLETRHMATYIPPLGRATDILSAVIEKPKSKWYFIDFPRAFYPNRETWAAIEMVKNGIVYDHRYKYKEVDLGINPRVSVFCNVVPPILSEYLSRDRIKIYQITQGGGIWGRDALIITERPDWKNWVPEPDEKSRSRS